MRKTIRVGPRTAGSFLKVSNRAGASVGAMGGFSLIELMMVLAILGVLLGIAIPNYTSYLERTRRSEARTALLDIAAAQERHFFEQRQYSGSMANVWGHKVGGEYASAEGFYLLSVAITNGGQNYSATATAQGKQEGDTDCATLSIDETGRKSGTAGKGGDPSVCW